MPYEEERFPAKEECLSSPVRCLCRIYLKPQIRAWTDVLRRWIEKANFERLEKEAKTGNVIDLYSSHYETVQKGLDEIARIRGLMEKLGCR